MDASAGTAIAAMDTTVNATMHMTAYTTKHMAETCRKGVISDFMKQTDTIHITGLASFAGQLDPLSQHNPDYDLTRTELIEKGLVGERIYEHTYPCEDVALSPEEGTGMIQVLVTGVPIGYVRKASCPYVQSLLDKQSIRELSIKMHGGPYRILLEGREDEPVLEEAEAALFALLEIVSEEADAAPAAEGDSAMHYISTTYDTQVLDDSGRRGNAPLVLSLLLAGFYLGFSIPYWILIHRGVTTAVPRLGGSIAGNLLLPHLILAAAALALTVLSLIFRKPLLPLGAALLFLLSCVRLPGMTLFVLLPALLCLLAAFRIRGDEGKMAKIARIAKFPVLIAVLAGSIFLLRPTAQEILSTGRLIVRPTGSEVFDFETSENTDNSFEQLDDFGGDEAGMDQDYENAIDQGDLAGDGADATFEFTPDDAGEF